MKSMRKPFEIFFVLLTLGILLHPKRREILSKIRNRAEDLADQSWAIWLMSGIYFLLYMWQQVTKYLALEINFIPYLFFDYMLWYFEQGKLCYTGLLHGFYHANLIMLSLFPIWKLFHSSWVLHIAHPLLTVLAVIPLYYWSRDQLKDSFLALIVAFVYLNFRYLQNLLLVNFVVEVFYPLLILSAIYFASKKNEWLYYSSLILGLLTKEDSAIYFGALGAFFLFLRGHRKRGLYTMALSFAYLVFVLRIFMPWSGSDILEGDLQNYPALGPSPAGIFRNILKNPWLLIKELFVPFEKVRTFFKLASKLIFLPVLSPWFILVIASIYPLYFQGGDYFIQLAFHYTAAVLPFLFIAFADGWKRFLDSSFSRKIPSLKWITVTLLIFLNGMNLRPLHFTRDDLKTIALVKSLPPASIVVTQGHLLPYLGYKKYNFYISSQYEGRTDTREAYLKPDYYLFDFEANAYPLNPEDLRAKADALKKNPIWKIVYLDHRRLLLQRITR